jgi:hypothetical protein
MAGKRVEELLKPFTRRLTESDDREAAALEIIDEYNAWRRSEGATCLNPRIHESNWTGPLIGIFVMYDEVQENAPPGFGAPSDALK